MSIVVRRTGNKEYAYEAHREGTRMIQSYIGPLARLDVLRRVQAVRRAKTIPEHTMRLFAGEPGPLLHRDEASIIERILEQGDLEDLQWLTFACPVGAIIDVLMTPGMLSQRSQNFWTAWFEVNGAS